MRSFGSSLGRPALVPDIAAHYTADVQRVVGHGYRAIHRAEDGVGLTDLAATAAERALAGAGMGPGDVDLLVLAITDIPEYLYWDAAAHVQHRLGAHRAEAVLVDQGCVGGVTCLDLVAGRFATHPEYRTALVVGANRTCEPYWNRMETHSLLFSDGAAAAVLARGHDRLRWRASEALTDGRYADFFRMDVGGAAAPFTAGGLEPTARDAWDLMEFFDFDTERFTGFVDLMNDRLRVVVERACKRIGRTTADLARVVLLNDNARTLADVASRLNVPLDRTNAAFSLAHGHFGAADHLLVLGAHVEAGEVEPGDLVALAAVGRGMHWAAAVVEV